MLKARTLGTALCFGALAVLPACSMFGGSNGTSGQYRQTSSSGAYNTASTAAPQAGTTTNGQAAITPDTIRDVQTNLKQANLYSGRVDGVWGPATERGVRQWQQQHNVTASGQLDMATLQAMNISSSNSQNTASDQTNTNQPNYSSAGNHATGNNYSNNTPGQTTNTPYTTQPSTAPNNTNSTTNSTTTNTTNPSQPTH